MPTFTTTLLQDGNNVGIVVPPEVVARRHGHSVPILNLIYRNVMPGDTAVANAALDKFWTPPG